MRLKGKKNSLFEESLKRGFEDFGDLPDDYGHDVIVNKTKKRFYDDEDDETMGGLFPPLFGEGVADWCFA